MRVRRRLRLLKWGFLGRRAPKAQGQREKKVYQVIRKWISGYQDVDIRISEYQVAGHQGKRDPPEADKFSIREGLFK